MARNKAIALYRRSSHIQLDEETATTLEDPSDDPAITLEKKDRSAILRKCLTQLSPLHREVVDLVYYHQKSVEEVAQITGAAKGTVKTRMFYARTQMKTLLRKDGINSVSM
jgi:RNA polymerase sigma-70 factor (ECF subfamily)